jgi:hypothetical protein
MPPPPLSHIKLTRLAELMGFATKEDLIRFYLNDQTVPGICINPDCEYRIFVERDERQELCQREGTYTVQSCLVIAGLIP